MANPPLPKKTPSPKGKPMGIPVWGWVIAAVIGIVVGYTILKQGKRNAAGFSSDGGSESGFSPESENSSSGGTIALPIEDILKALGLTPAGGSSAGGNDGGNGNGGGQTSSESSAQQEAEMAAEAPSVSDPIVQDLINQGVPIAPEGTTVDFQGTTYNVSGTPEFSPGNFNPNSPAGVLAMNQAIANTGTVSMPGSVPVSPPKQDIYTSDNQAQNEAVAAAGGPSKTKAIAY